jgi:type I restriction enzyme S subunit
MSELPKGWVETTLGDCCAFENGDRGKNYSGRSTFVRSGIPFISAGHLSDGRIDWDEMNYIPPENFDRLGSGKVKSGDFLFCLRGSLGKHAFVPKVDAAAIASSLVIVRPSHLVASQFVDYYFRSPLVRASIETHSNGVAQPNLSSASLGRFEFPLPPLAEQKRIVAKLDALAAKSARARTELARLETLVTRYKQAVLSKAFDRKLRDSEQRFGEFIETAGNGLSKREGDQGEWINVLRLADLDNGEFSPEAPRQIRLTDKEADKYRLTKGDVVVIRVNGSTNLVGRSFCFETEDRWAFCDHFIRVRLNSTFDPTFAVLFLNSPAIRSIIEHKFVSTSGQKTISQKTLEELPALAPPLSEQHEIVRRIKSAFARIDRLAADARRALALLGKLDEAILAKAFRGELVPQDDTDEPAETLLDRIRAERAATPKAKRGRGRART